MLTHYFVIMQTFGEFNLQIMRLDALLVECEIDFHRERFDILENEAILLMCSLTANQNKGIKLLMVSILQGITTNLHLSKSFLFKISVI